MSGHDGDDLVKAATAIESKADFDEFFQRLLSNFREHPEEWENRTLEYFLDAMGGFVGSLEGYYSNNRIEVDLRNPGWRVFADILLASRVYE